MKRQNSYLRARPCPSRSFIQLIKLQTGEPLESESNRGPRYMVASPHEMPRKRYLTGQDRIRLIDAAKRAKRKRCSLSLLSEHVDMVLDIDTAILRALSFSTDY